MLSFKGMTVRKGIPFLQGIEASISHCGVQLGDVPCLRPGSGAIAMNSTDLTHCIVPLFLLFRVPLQLLSFAIGGLGKSIDTFVSTFLLDSAVLQAMDFLNQWRTKQALHPGFAFIERHAKNCYRCVICLPKRTSRFVGESI